MLFVTDDHRTVRMPKETVQPRGVIPEAIDPVLLAAIRQTNACSSKVKRVIKQFKNK